MLAPEPTFMMVEQIAGSLGLEFVGVPLNPADFALDWDAMTAAIKLHRSWAGSRMFACYGRQSR
ncbi:MAG: hypothetical protein ACRESZ_22945 [Methylococcales bacterium]